MAGKSVLTTGANSGIGLATVIEVARRGYHSIGSVRSATKADIVHRAASDAGVEVETVIIDVNDAAQCEEIVGGRSLFGLVNNAGYGLTGAVEDVPEQEARALFDTMVFAPMRLSRLVLTAMRRAGEGRIVNISSVAGRTTAPFAGWYTGAKHALEALSDAMRIEVASLGVKVVLVEPGGFRTNIWDDFEGDAARWTERGSRHAEAYRRSLDGQKRLDRLMGQPETVAKVVVAALGARLPRARYLVGADAQLLTLADTMTPTFIKDRIIRMGLGI